MFITYLFAALFLITLAGFLYLTKRKKFYNTGLIRSNLEVEKLRQEVFDLEERIGIVESQKQLSESRAEEAILGSEKKLKEVNHFKEFVEETDEFLFEADYKGNFLYANPVMLDRLGYMENEIRMLNYQQLISPEKLEEVLGFYLNQYQNKIIVSSNEWQVNNRFGETMYLGVRIYIVYDSDGKILRVKGSARDLSIQKSMAKKHRLFDEVIEKYLMSDPNPMLVFEIQTRLPLVEKAKLSWTNSATLHLMSLHWFEVESLTLDQISSSLLESVIQKISEPTKVVFWNTAKGPNQVFQVQSTFLEDILVINLIDISNSISQQNILRTERDFYFGIVDDSATEISVISNDDKYVYTNKSTGSNSEIRSGMIGKTDEEVAKAIGNNLSIALLRKSTLDHVRLLQQKVQFIERVNVKDFGIKTYLRELSPMFSVNKELEGFVFTGIDQTEMQLKLEELSELVDRLFFRFRCVEYHPNLQSDAFHKENWNHLISGLFDSFNDHFINDSNRKDSSAHLYPISLSGFSEQIQSACMSMNNLSFQTIPSFQNSFVFLLPTAFILETIQYLGSMDKKEKYQVRLIETVSQENKQQIQIEFRPIKTRNWIEKERVVVSTLVAFWSEFHVVLPQDESQFVLTIPLIDANRSEANIIETPLQILKGKKVIVGPSVARKANWTIHELQHHGADVIGMKTLFGINKYLNSGEFNLVIWWGDSMVELKELDLNLLKSFEIKLLLYSTIIHLNIPEDFKEWIVVLPHPITVKDVVEQVWLHSKTNPETDLAPGEKMEAIDLNFNMLLEITEGDKDFMQNLFVSYFTSLADCKTDFETHLLNEDSESLKFLLHKIRATIKTFDIRSLELVLLEAIEKIELKLISEKADKNRFVKKVNRICNNVKAKLKTFALSQGISV